MVTKAPNQGLAGRLSGWNARHPVLAILLVSLLATLINCHPLLFGRSYVSPASMRGNVLLYSWPPFFPGVSPDPEISSHGSDTAATLLWEVPAGFIESRSLQQGELPLWNRYCAVGNPFIGQAVSMLGDPLQLIVILGRGSAAAWDLKFLAAKFLFCAGFGLLTWRLWGSQPLALIQAALAAYCGAWFFINNHPVFFVFAYAPWILLSALAWLTPGSRHHFYWGFVWLLANFACFNAGHVEVAVILIGGLNLAAVAFALVRCRRAAEWAVVLGHMGAGTLLFLGLTAPIWLSFLAALDGAFSSHAEISVRHMPIRALPGAFDDLFYQLLLPGPEYPAFAPGTSLLVLAGCVLSVIRWRQMKREPFFWVNAAAIGFWGGCIFGWIPASLLVHIPLLNRDGHTHTDFSYLLIMHLTLQSACGFLALARETRFRMGDFVALVAVIVGMMAWYCFSILHRPIPWNYFLCAATGAVGAPLLFAFLKCRQARISLAGWMGIGLLGFAAVFRFGLYSFGNPEMLLLVGPRLALDAPSPAIEKIKASQTAPFRVAGLRCNLFGDYAATYGLEDIHFCDPLDSSNYTDLVAHYPGVDLNGWAISLIDPVAAQSLLNLLNVKYLLAPPKVEVQPGLDFRVTDRSDFGVLENLAVWPRAFFTDHVVPIATTEEFIQQLLHHGQHPFAALMPQEIETQPGLRSLGSTQTVALAATHYQLLPNSTAFDIHAPTAGVACLSESQARDFTATANGEPKPVLTVNRVFKGIFLDRPGDYRVKFTYRPRHWRLACGLFFTAAGIVIALVGLHLRHAKTRRSQTTR